MTTARAALVREVKARPEFEVRGTKMEARPSGRLPLVRGETVLVLPMDSPAAGETVELLVDLEREKLPVTLGERVILPSSAFDRERGQYRAESLLALVAARDGRRILAVTGRDLYAEGQDFVFGTADARAHAALISLARLRSGADESVLRARAVKEAIHELGRTLGLAHCGNELCVMHVSHTLAEIDRKTGRLCDACLLNASRLARGGR